MPFALPLAALICLLAATSTAWAMNVQEVFKQVGDSVVVVSSMDAFGKPFALGSGFFVREDVVATNYHVVGKASRVEIARPGQKPVQVRSIMATDKEQDLALLKVDKGGSPLPLQLETPAVGEDVVAIGNPKGLERTVSPGIISGLRRMGKNERYQITAPISPGSSGGPIVNANGEVIGLATFFVQDGQNLNFAVPAHYVDKLLGGGGGARGLDTGPTGGKPAKKLEIKQDSGGVITIK